MRLTSRCFLLIIINNFIVRKPPVKKSCLTEQQQERFDRIDTSLQCAPDCPAVNAVWQLRRLRQDEYEDLLCKAVSAPGELHAPCLSAIQYETLKKAAEKSAAQESTIPRRDFLHTVFVKLPAMWSVKGAAYGVQRHLEIKKIDQTLESDDLPPAQRRGLRAARHKAEKSAASNATQGAASGFAALVADTTMLPYSEELSEFIGVLEQCIGEIQQQNAAGKPSPYHRG